MLEYLGIDYERKGYKLPDLGLASKESYMDLEWFREKWTLGLDHPNIPYVIDGEVRLSQTLAVMKYIARKGDRQLTPKTETETINCEMAEGAVQDIWQPFYMLIYNPEYKNMRAGYLAKIPDTFKAFEKVLGSRKWLGGDNLTYIDFQACEVLDHMELMCAEIFDDLPNVKNYKTNFFSLDKIKAYRESSRFKKWPLYAPAAAWGGKNEEEATSTQF